MSDDAVYVMSADGAIRGEMIHACQRDGLPCAACEIVKLRATLTAQEEEIATLRAFQRHLTHCEHCGANWWDDGLNGTTCPYCSWAGQKARAEQAEAALARVRELERFNCDCLPYEHDDPAMRPRTPHNGTDPIHLERDVILAEDLDAALTQPAPDAQEG